MRVLLFTGKGGVGKTTTAAATAALAAQRGNRVLVLSTDVAHSLADALDLPLGPQPTQVHDRLYAMQVDGQGAFERSWRDIQAFLLAVLERAGVDALQAEELTVLPGAEEVLALLEVKRQVDSGRWDVVVVDCAPTGETLRLLALPEALQRYADKIFPAQRRALKALRPLMSRINGPAVPSEALFAAVEQLQGELGQVRALLTSPQASVRLVLTPEAVVVAEARRTLTSLALYGYRVDGLVANRCFPAGSTDQFLQRWVAAQQEQLAGISRDAAPLPVVMGPYCAAEPVGLTSLLALGAALYGDVDPVAAAAPGADLLQVEQTQEGFRLSLALPLAHRKDLELARSGSDLIVTVAGHRRVLALPSALQRCLVAGASLADGRLAIAFTPDPALWMRT